MPIFFFEKTRRGLLVFFSVKAWRFNFFFKKPDQLNLIKQGTFPFYEGLLGCPKKDHCGVNRPLQRGRVGCVRFWRQIAGMHGDMVMPWSSGGGIFLHSKNGGLGGGFKIFLFSPLPGQSDPIWRIKFCTWVELVQPPTSGDFSVCPANLSWIPFVKDSPFGLNICGTFWWRRSLVRELWRHHLLKSCWFCCSYTPLQYTCQIFTICDFFVCPCMRFSIHRSIAILPAILPS